MTGQTGWQFRLDPELFHRNDKHMSKVLTGVMDGCLLCEVTQITAMMLIPRKYGSAENFWAFKKQLLSVSF